MTSNSLPPSLPGSFRKKLVGILGILGSNQAGERDAAALAATRLLLKSGLTWDQIVASPEPPTHVPPLILVWRETVHECLRRAPLLDAWECQFLTDLRARTRRPSPKQLEKLSEIASQVGVVTR